MKKLLFLFFLLIAKLSAFETSNIQLLYSNDFKGDAFIYDTKDGDKTTVTFEHFRTFSYGDFFMFIDIMDGNKFDGKSMDIYTELAPRFSLSTLFERDFSNEIIRDLFVATQLNVGDEYRGYLYGVGIDLNVEGLNFLSLNLYNKDENIYKSNTYQFTAAYQSEMFSKFLFEGYLDQTKRDTNTHNRLLYSLDEFLGNDEQLFFGVEWIYYKFDYNGKTSKTSVAQVMLKYIF